MSQKYRRSVVPEDLEEEQAELERQAEAEREAEARREEEENKTLNSEEQTFKKRYGDLRTHSQKMEKELRDKVAELEQQVKDAAKAQLEMKDVASPEDAKAWAQKYPEIAKIVRYIAMEESKETSEKVQKDVEELNELKKDIERRRAYAKLLEIHPDFEDVVKSPEFQTWIEEKGENSWVYKALYHNDSDPVIAADAVTLFKSQNPKRKEKDKNEENDRRRTERENAAQPVTRKSNSDAPASGDDEITWSESYIEEMSVKDKKFFDKNEEKIMDAIRKGKFKYDITGAAQ